MAGFGFSPSGFGFPSAGGQFGDGPTQPAYRRQQRPEFRQPLPPEQAESFTKTLTNKGVSGLQYVLGSLDKPGRAVRGVLGGHADEALNLIPFSDSLGITDPERAVSGRDLLDKSGLTDKRSKGWGAWGAGVGAEMALDPLTYMTFGTGTALTRMGRAAANAGDLKNLSRMQRIKGYDGIGPALAAQGHDVERLANQGQHLAGQKVLDAGARIGTKIEPGKPLAGLAGIGLPFRDPSIVLGTGRTAQGFAGLMDKGASKLRYGNPVGRYLGAAFDPSAGDAVDAITQQAMSRYGTPAMEAAREEGRAQHFGILSQINKAVSGGIPERDLLSAAREIGEQVPTGHVPPPVAAAAQPIGAEANRIGVQQAAKEQSLGLPIRDLNDQFSPGYVPRSAVNIQKHGLQTKGDNLFPVSTGANAHRDALLREIPGGTSAFDRWVGQHAGHHDPAALAGQIRNDMQGSLVAGTPLPMQTPELAQTLDDKAVALADRIAGLSPDYRAVQHGPFAGGLTREGPGTFFTPDLAGDLQRRSNKSARTIGSASAVHGAIGENARLMAQAGPDAVSVPDLLDRLGLVSHAGDAATGAPATGALVEAYKKLARQGAGPIDAAMAPDLKAIRAAAAQYGVSPEHAEQLLKQYPKWLAPNTVAGPVKALDSFTNAFKNMTYSIWPTSHVRNAMSALSNNALYGSGAGSHGLAYRVMRDTASAAEIAAAHPGMPAGLTDEAAREWIRGQAYTHGKVFSGHTLTTDNTAGGAGLPTHQNGRITAPVPGVNRTGPTGNIVGDILNLGREGLLGRPGETSIRDVFGQAGVGGRTRDTWSPLAAGRTAGSNVEDYFRLANYLGNVSQGMHPTEAGRMVNKVHFDYENVTPFERKVMRRLVPFYTFQSRNLPLQLERLFSKPGTVNAQLRPLGRNDPDRYTPDHIASGVAIPTGPEQDGNQQFISQLGLPIEEAFERLKFQNGLPDVKGTAMSYMGGMNPLVKGPLERLFNTQFHTGRKLSDLHPTAFGSAGGYLGDDSANLLTQVIANTPLTRFASATDKLLDERKQPWAKALNLLSGVRVTDVDMEKQRAIEARKALEDSLSRSRNVNSYTNYYVRPENAGNLTPEEVKQMRMLTLLHQNAREYAEKRRREGL